MREMTMTVVYNEELVNGNFEEEVAQHVESFIGYPLHVSSQPVDMHRMSAAEAGANALLDSDEVEYNAGKFSFAEAANEPPRMSVTLTVWDDKIGIDSLSRLFRDLMRSHQVAAAQRQRDAHAQVARRRMLDEDDDD